MVAIADSVLVPAQIRALEQRCIKLEAMLKWSDARMMVSVGAGRRYRIYQ